MQKKTACQPDRWHRQQTRTEARDSVRPLVNEATLIRRGDQLGFSPLFGADPYINEPAQGTGTEGAADEIDAREYVFESHQVVISQAPDDAED